MDRKGLIARLVEEFGYSPTAASAVADDLAHSAPQIQAAFHTWREIGSLPELCVEGFTVAQLMDNHGMQPIAALLTLDWLLRDPAQAKSSLRKGHDRVSTRAR